MFDEMDRLRAHELLRRLLAHYVRAGEADREAWQDRLMEMDGVEPQALTRLHGELLAYGWLDQNTGAVAAPRPGAVPRCYRATRAGHRALRHPGHDPAEADEARAA
jgi:hypothetical protein